MLECKTCGEKLTGQYHIDCDHNCVSSLLRKLEEAELRINVMDCYICDEDRPRIEGELNETRRTH